MLKWLIVGLLLLTVLIALGLYFLPASLVPHALTEAEKRGLLAEDAPRLYLNEVEGRLWQGRANDTRLEIDGVSLDLGVMEWQLQALALLKRKVVLDVSTQSSTTNLKSAVEVIENGEITLSGLEGRLPIALFEPWFPLLVTGDIAFLIDQARFTEREILALDGIVNFEYVDWLGADHNMPLGSYMAQLGLAENRDVLVTINDYAAQLGLQGQIRLNRTGNYQFDAVLDARPDLAPEVAQSISWLGKVNRDGNVIIKQRGRL